jgi:hypothetical protein
MLHPKNRLDDIPPLGIRLETSSLAPETDVDEILHYIVLEITLRMWFGTEDEKKT